MITNESRPDKMPPMTRSCPSRKSRKPKYCCNAARRIVNARAGISKSGSVVDHRRIMPCWNAGSSNAYAPLHSAMACLKGQVITDDQGSDDGGEQFHWQQQHSQHRQEHRSKTGLLRVRTLSPRARRCR